MRKVYYYDGTFKGMLSSVFQSYYLPFGPSDIRKKGQMGNCQASLFGEILIETSIEEAERVYNSIIDRISLKCLRNVYYAFLSEEKGIEMKILRYLKLGWTMGARVDDLLTDERVNDIHERAWKVSGERHRYLGFIRFTDIHGIYYAPFEPSSNILELLCDHFASRLKDQYWVIHDRKRQIAALYDKRSWVIRSFQPSLTPSASKDEVSYRDLWKTYCHSTWIRGRTNLGLQTQNMPKKYWKYLTEKMETSPGDVKKLCNFPEDTLPFF